MNPSSLLQKLAAMGQKIVPFGGRHLLPLRDRGIVEVRVSGKSFPRRKIAPESTPQHPTLGSCLPAVLFPLRGNR